MTNEVDVTSNVHYWSFLEILHQQFCYKLNLFMATCALPYKNRIKAHVGRQCECSIIS